MFNVNRQFTVVVNDTERLAKTVALDEGVFGALTQSVTDRNWDGRTSIITRADDDHITLRSVVGTQVTDMVRKLEAVPASWLPAEGEAVVVFPPANVTGRKRKAQPRLQQPPRQAKPAPKAETRAIVISVSVQGADWIVSYSAPKPDGTTDGAVKTGKVDGYKPGQATVMGALKAALEVWEPKPQYHTTITRISDSNVVRMLKGEMQSKANAELLAEVKALCARHQVTFDC